MALLLPAVMLQASPVSPELAHSIAAQHLCATTSRHAAPGRTVNPTLLMTARSANQTVADYYVFSVGMQDGYVIVAGDDRAPSVLAYSDEGTFDPADMPDGMRYMLDVYAQEMAMLRNCPASYSPASRAQRENVVRPMLTCNWNQNAPFNNLCPTYASGGKTERSVTGCVATATAQIMFYHKHPAQGTGSKTYECKVNETDQQTLSADFEHTTYQWDKMINDYSGEYSVEQGNAVATLLYHVGVAAGMEYGKVSAVGIFKMMNALRNHFGYSRQMRQHCRSGMTTSQWESIIYSELAAGRPVLFDGTASDGGHAFVLDGYDENGYVHINWGWGGKSNGYFMLTALNPDTQGIGSFEGGYNTAQTIIVGICPSQGEEEPERYFDVSAGSFTASGDQVKLGEKIPMLFKHVRATGYGCPTTVNLDLLMFVSGPNGEQIEQDTDGNNYLYKTEVGDCYEYTETDPAKDPFSFTAPATLPNGEYKLWLFYKCPEAGVSEYRGYTHNEHVPAHIDVEVKDGVMHFRPQQATCDLAVTAIDYPKQVGTSSHVSLSATVRNNGAEYLGYIHYDITRDGQTVSRATGQMLALATGGEVLTRTVITAPATAGDYELKVSGTNGALIGGPYQLKVVESSGHTLDIQTQLAPTAYSMPSGNVTGSAVLVNNGTGDFVGTIPYMILNRQANDVLLTGETPMVTIAAGQSATINITSTFEGTPGLTYGMCLRSVDAASEYNVWGEIAHFTIEAGPSTSIDRVSDPFVTVTAAHGLLTVSGASRVAVYNITGALMGTGSQLRLPSGAYIVVADGTVHKVLMH